MAKRYNTIEVKVKKIDRAVNRQAFVAIESVHHLTPATEAEMENCLSPDGEKIPVPSRAQTIKRNSPGYVSPLSEPTFEQARDEEDTRKTDTEKGPTRAALNRIEAEPDIHALLAKVI